MRLIIVLAHGAVVRLNAYKTLGKVLGAQRVLGIVVNITIIIPMLIRILLSVSFFTLLFGDPVFFLRLVLDYFISFSSLSL